MGPSGCGKTTLLDSLAGRLPRSAKLSGQVLLNGRASSLTHGTAAYVTQDDVLIGSLTVMECMMFVARLRLPSSVTHADKLAKVNYILHIKALCMGCCTVVAVIHQPSSEVFELFDKLCLLAAGEVLTYGPTEHAVRSFESVGLPVPLHINPSDHFLHCINADFEDHPNWFTQTFYLTWRNLLNMMRNVGLFWIRAGMYIMLCLVLGFVYFQLRHTWHDVFSRTALIFFGVAFLTFMSIAAFPAFVEEMQVFIQERLNGYYGVSQFVVANTIAATPFVFLIAVLSSVTVYWLASLNPSGGSVIYFILDLFLSLMVVESMMMAIAPLVPHYLMGIAAGSGLLGIFMLVCGFFQPAGQLPRPILYYPLHYMAFHTYSFYGFMKNEFVGTDGWGCPCSIMANGCSIMAVGGSERRFSGEQVLASYDVWSLNKWVDLALLGAWIVFYRAAFLSTLKLKERISM
ncbi:hypothetical protein WJX74_006208 [Apatococcus lobatus]|uniref:ABC transporter domain-containing protein n=1 Tax=Apatococcus lobatus TaxID=904363 RepID=A0AAW1QBR7_9CHLO